MTKYINLFQKLIILSLCIILNQSMIGQEGSPYITNYELNTKLKFQNWSIVQGLNEYMFFANQKGILSFDGHSSELIKTPSVPTTICYDTAHAKLFIGCENDIGYLDIDTTGAFYYVSMKDPNQEIGKVYEMASRNDSLYVISDFFVSVFNIQDYSVVNQIIQENDARIYELITFDTELFFLNEKKQFFVYENDELKRKNIKNTSRFGDVLFDFHYKENLTVIGTSDNKLWFFGGKSVWQVNLQDQKYLNESVLTNAIYLSDSKIVISTLIGGILIVDLNTKKTVKTVNYSSGLPDNEIYAIGKDDDNGVWLSHSLGISRIDFGIPIKFYNSYPGVEGRVLSIIKHNNSIFVGTNEHLFFLKEIDEYNRARMIEKQISSISRDIRTEKEIKAKKESERKGIFKGLKKKIEKIVSPGDEIAESERRRNLLIKKRRLLGLQSVSHQYEKIEGIDDRCKILVSHGENLLVGGNNGLYEVIEDEFEKILSDYYIQALVPDDHNPDLFYVCTSEGLLLANLIEDKREFNVIDSLAGLSVHSVFINNKGVWAGTDKHVFLLDTATNTVKEYEIDNRYSEPCIIKELNDQIFVLLPSEIFYYSKKKDKLVSLLTGQFSYFTAQSESFWVDYNGSYKPFIRTEDYNTENLIYLNLFTGIEFLYIDESNNTWIIDDNGNLFKIQHEIGQFIRKNQKIYIKHLYNQDNSAYSLTKDLFLPDENFLKVHLSAPYYIKQNSVSYQYFLEGLMKRRSPWISEHEFSFPYIPSGNYTLFIKAKNNLGTVSEELSYSFSIQEPFWKKNWFLISTGVSFILIIVLIIHLRERNLQRKKRILEEKVKERTKTIEEQKDQLALKNKNIQDSITYAKRIQNAIMPSAETLNESFNEYFVFFKPRDIVSGDFYWVKQIHGFTVYAVADCTGHGVPGALLSMLGISFLEEIVTKARFDTPDVILNRLRKKVKKSLKQSSKDQESKDGMDIALCVIDHESLELQFAGAYNPVYILRAGELIELKATRNPIGFHMKEKDFEKSDFQLQQGDVLYTFSDGYTDQFGDEGRTKFNKTNFKKLIQKISDKPMPEQEDILGKILMQWQGKNEQTDDIIVVGVRV